MAKGITELPGTVVGFCRVQTYIAAFPDRASSLDLPLFYQIITKLTKMADQEAHREPGTSEEEPLLGRRGDASQQEGLPLYHNFVIGKHVRVASYLDTPPPDQTSTDHG